MKRSAYLNHVPLLPVEALQLLDGRRRLSFVQEHQLNRKIEHIARRIREERERHEERTGERVVVEPPFEG